MIGPMASPKVICFYTSSAYLDGAERDLLDLIGGLQKSHAAEYRPWVVLPRADSPLEAELVKMGVDFDILPTPKSFYKMTRNSPLNAFQLGLRSIPGMGFYLSKLILLLRKKDPVIIHTVGVKCHGIAAIVAPPTGIPVVWSLRDLLEDGPGLWTLRTLQKTSGVHVVASSRTVADAFLPGDAKVPVIHSGLDLEVYKPSKNRIFNSMMGLPSEVPIVGILGPLSKSKGQQEFVEMAIELLKQGTRAGFVVVGGELPTSEGFAASLKSRIEAEGFADRSKILLTGFRTDAVETLNALDVLVHSPLHPEGFSRVLLEAMACGVPVAAASSPGVQEIVESWKNGLKFQQGDIPGMASAVKELLSNSERRESVVAQALLDVRARFERGRYVAAWTRVFESLLEWKKRRRTLIKID
jgi:glycosyltransferase involved in cell wall biosynthesis